MVTHNRPDTSEDSSNQRLGEYCNTENQFPIVPPTNAHADG
jgi:hypothetical protein